MSRKRYNDTGKYLHINDNATAVSAGQDGYDPLFKIRPVINCVKQACNTLFRPGAAISFDEAMIPFQGRLWFKQYIKGKPHPWDLKVWCCCDSATSFLLDFYFYTGKGQADYPHGLGYHVIWTLGQPYLRKNHHFYFDNFFLISKANEGSLRS
ncbi:PiggyBac transposable element-derived protein 4-like [Plakobranchus ocellatus]|uniref:PiggyBac transposable element-derived protein 4-like n=1 Tax=Plakobranchus ocellatus TaxID=259542 RepID=A0AAV4A9Z5_9GAST|nr:PiggyBac transposable element-derived protein 4-like [Plakobranchus ocellatus]